MGEQSRPNLGEDDVGGVGRAEAALGDVEHGAAPEHPLGDVVGGVRGGRGRGRGGPRRGGGGRRLRRRRGGVAGGGGGLHPQPSLSARLAAGRVRVWLVDSDTCSLASRESEGRREDEAELNC